MATQQYLINGCSDLLLSPLDRGLAYGDGVFRTLRVHNQVPHHWDLHYQKLSADCYALGISCPSADILLADIQQLFAPDESAVAKIIITRGEGERGYAPSATSQPTRLLIKSPLPNYAPGNFSEGIDLHLCSLRLSRQPKLAGIKHLNRLENVMARMEWSDPRFAEGLLLDERGHAIECTASNIFARFGKMLLTPDLRQCGVAGITRQRILNVTPHLDYRPRIAPLPFSRLMQADEIIICNSLYGVWQVKSLNNQNWPPQDLAAKLRAYLQD